MSVHRRARRQRVDGVAGGAHGGDSELLDIDQREVSQLAAVVRGALAGGDERRVLRREEVRGARAHRGVRRCAQCAQHVGQHQSTSLDVAARRAAADCALAKREKVRHGQQRVAARRCACVVRAVGGRQAARYRRRRRRARRRCRTDTRRCRR